MMRVATCVIEKQLASVVLAHSVEIDRRTVEKARV